MLSLLGAVYKYMVQGRRETEVPIEELEKAFLVEYQLEINAKNSETTKDDESTGANNVENVGVLLNSDELCQHRSGIITELFTNYGLVDGQYHFDRENSHVDLTCGLRVKYIAFRNNVHENWRVHRIVSIQDENWEKDAPEEKCEILQKSHAINRKIIAQVQSVNDKIVIVEPYHKFCLDDVKGYFIPLPGDWLSLTCLVELDGNVQDFSGEILNVNEMGAIRLKNFSSPIIQWNEQEGEGIIEGNIWFRKSECEQHKLLQVTDLVSGQAIESTQGTCTWRALSVELISSIRKPKQDIEEKRDHKIKCHSVDSKNGVFITNNLNFGTLKRGQCKELKVEIVNNSDTTQILRKGKFHGRKSESQLSIRGLNDNLLIIPGQRVICHFCCTGKFLGQSTELFVFTFLKFKIFRYITIEVQDLELSELINTNLDNTSNSRKKYVSFERKKEFLTGYRNIIPGVRPFKPPNFVPVNFPGYNIPKYIWKAVLGEEEQSSLLQAIERVKHTNPCLAEDLKASNYCTKFHVLLHLEEIEKNLRMCHYDMENVVFSFVGPSAEYLALTIPGLAEKRPSLLVGDKVTAYKSSNKGIKYEGYIHQVSANEIRIKFGPYFHSSYDSSEYSVSFICGRAPFRRCHIALDIAFKHLGGSVLFPERICVKKPQIALLEDSEQNNFKEKNNEVSSHYNEMVSKNTNVQFHRIEKNIRKAGTQNLPRGKIRALNNMAVKLKWFNSHLNLLQMEAVKSIVKGLARPLPYIIFGPPGTGKTVTLVESILQIYSLIPDSRIIVATPSNSSANLIAERLLTSDVLSPGCLVRLVAYHCLEDGSVPEILWPYCTTCDIDSKSDRVSSPVSYTLKTSSNAKVLGRHRITVGTCVALGQLYTMGFPKGHFTHIFVDEAGQAVEPEILIPLGFLHRDSAQVVLAGDPMQLGPVVMSRIALHYDYNQSFLSRLLKTSPYERNSSRYPASGGYNPQLLTKLLMNYRSLPEILSLPSSLFYHSLLEAQVNSEDSPEATLLNTLKHILPTRSSSIPPAIVFHGIRGCNIQDNESPSWYNPQEIVQVLYYLKDMFDSGLTVHDIGVITPYQKQVQKLRSFLTLMEVPVPKIGSVEEFQGQERMVIILSTVRSTPKLVQNDLHFSLGFVAKPQRLNVAITRARALLIIVGNPHLLATDPHWKRTLLYCIDHDAYTGCDLPLELHKYEENEE